MIEERLDLSATEVKSCCANLYQSDVARLLLGDSFHPGGVALTSRMGDLLGLRPGMALLDVAAGRGTSAVHLAATFGVSVTGVDYGGENIAAAREAAARAGVAHLATFVEGDAERLDLPAGSFDAVICECAYCTFPNKEAAASEFSRVLKPGGQVGLSDLTRAGPLPASLDGLLAWIACIADAQPIADYTAYLAAAGLPVTTVEPHDEALTEMIGGIRTKLIGAELMTKLGKLNLPGVDFDQAKGMARAANDAVKDGKLGYAILIATKPAS